MFATFSLLLGKFVNKPAQGFWFTPGGRIRKNEPFDKAIQHTAKNEIGLQDIDQLAPVLMGAWDHFYPDSVFSDSVLTHYVNLPHRVDINSEYKSVIDSRLACVPREQHSEWIWVSFVQAAHHNAMHP